LSEEEPDIDPYADTEDDVAGPAFERKTRAGRLVADDDGTGGDDEDELIAHDVGIDAGAASAEEAAIHVDDPNDDDTPSR
jgi:hypothetical protein